MRCQRSKQSAEGKRGESGKVSKILIFVLLCCLAGLAILSMRQKSVTYDEGVYYGLGKYILQHRRWDTVFSVLHPPLSYYLHSIPLFILKSANLTNEARKKLVLRSRGMIPITEKLEPLDYFPLLFQARIVIVLLSVLLGFYVFKWSKELYGQQAGLLALFLYSFSPNILAHSRLITADLVFTCFSFVGLYYFWLFVKEPTRKLLLWSGATLGLALLSKYPAILLFPIYLLIGIAVLFSKMEIKSSLKVPLENLFAKKFGLRRTYTLIMLIIMIFVVSVLVLNLGYGFRETLTPFSWYHFKSHFFSRWQDNRFFASFVAPLPSPYLRGMDFQGVQSEQGQSSFLAGKHSTTGWWYYYLFVFLIKTPIPFLIFLLFTLLFFKRIRHRLAVFECFLIIPILSFVVYFSFFSHLNIGLRYILPVFPLMHVFVSKVVRLKFKRQKIFVGTMIFLIGWYLISSLSIFPHYLAYFNEFIGGPRNGYKYLIDSNLDWGQDNKLMLEYVRKSKEPVKINPEQPTKGKIAVHANRLQGIQDYPAFPVSRYEWLRKHEPVDNVGYSWLVYEVR